MQYIAAQHWQYCKMLGKTQFDEMKHLVSFGEDGGMNPYSLDSKN